MSPDYFLEGKFTDRKTSAIDEIQPPEIGGNLRETIFLRTQIEEIQRVIPATLFRKQIMDSTIVKESSSF